MRDLSGDGDGNSGSSPSRPASVLLVTIWELGEAAGPLVMAPLSEALGRYAVLNGANAVFVAATALAARSSSVGQLVAARVLTGLAVATNVLGPAVVGDIFPRERRGAALSLLYLASLAGGAVAPLVGSAGAHALGWRRVVALTAALAAACELLFLTCFRETYSVAILRRRRQAANKAAGCAAPSSSKTVPVCDDEGPRAPLPETAVRASSSSLSELAKLRDAVLRPAVVLCGSGVLLALSLFGSVAFAFFYVMSTTLSDILVDIYGLSPVAVGLCYTANCKSPPFFSFDFFTRVRFETPDRYPPTYSYRLGHQRRGLQPHPRPHLRAHARRPRRRRQARVPAAALRRGRLRAAARRRRLRLVRGAAPAARLPALGGVPDGHGADAGHAPRHGLRRRRLRPVRGLGPDRRHRHALPDGHLPAADDRPAGRPVWPRLGIHGPGRPQPAPGPDPGPVASVRRALEEVFQVHTRCMNSVQIPTCGRSQGDE